MAINFAATFDNKNILAAVREAQQAMNKLSQAVDGVGDSVDQATSSIKEMIKQAAALGGISLGMAGVKEFLTQMISVRKEMQGYQTALNVLLGDQDKANAIFGELKTFATTTPLMFKDLASGAQTMLGFNIEAEKVVPTLKAIGDISMGDAQKFQSLTLAFSQMSATGKLMGQDLLQMINAGFNPLAEISRKTGRSISDLKDDMSAGAISAEMVAEAFMSATHEGGQFYGMLEKQGKGLAGQINTLNGAIDDMYNNLAKQSEGVITSAIEGVTTLVQNYDKVGKAIATMVATYGTYKAALVATVAIERVRVLGMKEAVKYTWLEISATKAATVAQNLFNKAVKANPYVIAASALVAVAGAMWTFAKNANDAKNSQEAVNDELRGFTEQQEALDQELKQLIGILQDENATNTERIEAYEQLKQKCHQLTDAYSMEKLAVMDLKGAYEALEKTRASRKTEHLEDQKEEVQNVLKAVQNAGGAWGNLDDKTYAFLEARGFVGKSLKQVEELLKADLEEWDKKIEQHQQEMSQQAAETVTTTYQEDAKKALEAWHTAKKEYERILKDEKSTAEDVITARNIMEAADAAYEKITKRKASKEAEDAAKLAKQRAQESANRRDLEAKIAHDEERAARDRELDTTQARINAMKEGSEKTLAQIDLDYQREMETIRRDEEDLKDSREQLARELWEAQNPELVRRNPDAWATSGEQKKWRDSYKLSDADKEFFAQREQEATFKLEEGVKNETEAARKAMQEYLIQYGNYEQQRLAITEKYQELINKAKESGNKGEELLYSAQLDKELSDLSTKFGFSNSKLSKLFKDVSGKSKKEIKSMIADLDKLYKKIKDGKLTEDEKKELSLLGFSEEDIKAIESAEKPVDAIIARIKELSRAAETTGTAYEQFGEIWEKTFGENGKVNAENIGDLSKSFEGVLGNAKGYVSAMKELASVLGMGKVASALEDVDTVLNDIGTGAQIGGSFGGWGPLIGAIVGTLTGVTKAIAGHTDDFAINQQNKINKSIRQLEKSYDDLSDAVDRTYSKQKQTSIEGEIRNIQRQNELINEQIRLENTKKDPDKSAIASYEDQIYQNQRRIKELQKDAESAIFGNDIQQAIENFADAYAEAWASNSNRTKTAKEQVREMMQQMVKESMKAAIEASGAMEKIRKKLADFFSDGVLSAEEQEAMYREAEALQKEMDARFGWAGDLMDKNNDFMQQGTSGGFATASQESTDELNGRFAAGQMTMEGILAQTMLIYASGQQMLSVSTESNETLKEIRNLMISMAGNVEDIAAYTKPLTTFGQKFDEMNRKLERL